jgi:serine protease Do
MVTTNTVVEDFDFFSGPEYTNVRGLGSGVIYRSDGYILTNNHVVNGLSGMADKIAVVLSSGKSYPAKVIGVDPQTDLAVLKINYHNLPSPDWADSDQIQVGETAIAIGNPLEETLNNTVTVGVVSAKGRNIKLDGGIQLRNLIQTDASINLGNSGGPLLDLNGRIIGINTLIAAKSQGIGFSIPSNTVKNVAEQLIEKGHVSRPGLGITYIHFTEQNVHFFELRVGRKMPVANGLFVARVIRGTEAEKAGLKPGDIIVAINGRRVGATDLFREMMTACPLGSKLKMDVIRGNRLVRAAARIGE